MFHVGVLAPTLMSAAGLMGRFQAAEHLSGERRPIELTLSLAPLVGGTEPWQRRDRDTVRSQLALNVARLRQAGAHFFVCSDESAYAPLDSRGPELALPGLHVASVLAAEAQRQGFARIGFLGTRWTLDHRRYVMNLEPMGIVGLPLSLRDQTTLHSIVFDELVHNRYWMRSRDLVLEMIDDLLLRGCHAVVLSCPELVGLVSPSNSPVPLLDPAALLAAAAVKVATGELPLPAWFGGPPEAHLWRDDDPVSPRSHR